MGERLDEHESPVRPQAIACVGARTGRVAHVVEAVEEADEIEDPFESRGCRDLELDPIGQSCD